MLLATVFSVDPFGHRPRPGSGTAFLVLVAFLISFLAIRTSARLTRSVSWWPGGVKSGDVHIHHLVWGICMMMFAGFLAFATPLVAPWWHIVAITFGIGVGFTLDEFALWVHLEDVYWTDEGRASLDAVVVATAFAALVVVGTNPLGLDDPASISGTAAAVTVILGLAVVCFLKGRALLGVVGLSFRCSRSWGPSVSRIRPRRGRAGATRGRGLSRPAHASILPAVAGAGSGASAISWPVPPLRRDMQRSRRVPPATTIHTAESSLPKRGLGAAGDRAEAGRRSPPGPS